MVLTAYLVLTPERLGLVVSVAARAVYLHDLAPATRASGRHALAVRQHAARQACAFASIASRPTIVTTRSPLLPRRDERIMRMIFRKTEAEYFSPKGWTNSIFFGFTKVISPTTGKSFGSERESR